MKKPPTVGKEQRSKNFMLISERLAEAKAPFKFLCSFSCKWNFHCKTGTFNSLKVLKHLTLPRLPLSKQRTDSSFIFSVKQRNVKYAARGQVYNVVSNSQQMTKKIKNDFYKSSEMTAIMLEKSIAPSLFLK